jgi:hypothetical protein
MIAVSPHVTKPHQWLTIPSKGSNSSVPFRDYAGVAQLARALPCQGRGRGFESLHPLHFFPLGACAQGLSPLSPLNGASPCFPLGACAQGLCPSRPWSGLHPVFRSALAPRGFAPLAPYRGFTLFSARRLRPGALPLSLLVGASPVTYASP